jgi:hypothetical protein
VPVRAPRYRFPDQVRNATRAIAAQSVREGTVAETAEELDARIAGAPDVRATFEQGGYGSAFTAHDLFPLYEVFVADLGGGTPRAEPPAGSPGRGWIVAAVIAATVIVVLVLAAAMGVFV